MVLHGETGLLTPADDVAAFAHALAQLANDPALRLRMGTAAAKRVEENFTADRMARQFEEAYAELAALPKEQLGWMQATRRLVGPYARLTYSRPSQPRYAS